MFSRTMDVTFGLAVLLTLGYYWVITRPGMEQTLLHRYTTEHNVEYVIVAFFIWGITDTVFRALALPRESWALREDWLPKQGGREPVSHAPLLYAHLQEKPAWLRESRLGQRLMQALEYLSETGTANDLGDHLRYLSELDEDRTHNNYGLIRFICWVTPVLGFLGTVLHFGTALGGLSADQMADQLSLVVGKMGTAFNTTTCALAASTSMMFSLFLCERTENGILRAIDRRTERELLNRFEMTDANMTPFMAALEKANATTLRAMEVTVQHQSQMWSSALESFEQQGQQYFQRQAKLWEEALARIQQQFAAGDREREKRLLQLLESVEQRRAEQQGDARTTAQQLATLRDDFARLVQGLSGITQGEQKLVELQTVLAENLRILRETQQIDEALHGLTGAIHLLTARHQGVSPRDHRAA
ncbi:MAG: MotA/TolQ/ExbB proton channel family protein [Planctomycetaceae bacterium]|nr:MotA/TolQ/ExbB proton channel family protein [Planctomycetaceae bacterium]